MLRYRLLGPLEVVDDDGAALRLGGQKQRALLAILLLRARHAVATDFLLEALWGEEPPRTAATSLQNFVSQLRKVVGPESLVTKPPGYLLRVEPGALDVERFEALVREANDVDDPAERSRLLADALALWHGEPLADVAFVPFAQAEIGHLEELRLVAVEDRIDADLEAGRHRALLPELEQLVTLHPLRERLRGQLLLALYRSGRQGEALHAYQEARRALIEELGIEPGPALQRLHASILRQEAALDVARVPVAADHGDEVVAAILSGRTVPVLGADAGALAGELATRFGYPDQEPLDLARVAQWVALTKGAGPLYDELHDLLGRGPGPGGVHRLLAALPPALRERGVGHQLLVTTGYDLALEQALLDAGEEFDVVTYVASGRDRGRFCHVAPDGTARTIDVPNTYVTELSLEERTIVLKLHGGLDPTPQRGRESFVVTEDDYIDYLAHSDIAAAIPVALAAKLRHSHFLFLGYGLRDWNARLVLRRVAGDATLSYRSWAVQETARTLEREFWRRWDVDLVEAPVEQYVEALALRLGVGVGPGGAALQTA